MLIGLIYICCCLQTILLVNQLHVIQLHSCFFGLKNIMSVSTTSIKKHNWPCHIFIPTHKCMLAPSDSLQTGANLLYYSKYNLKSNVVCLQVTVPHSKHRCTKVKKGQEGNRQKQRQRHMQCTFMGLFFYVSGIRWPLFIYLHHCLQS